MAKDFSYHIRSFGGLAHYAQRGERLQVHQSPDMQNFIITEDRRLKKRPGFRTLAQPGSKIRGLWTGLLQGQRHFLAVEGSRVRHSLNGFADTQVIGYLPGQDRVQILEFHGQLMLLGGISIRIFHPEEGLRDMVPYCPLVMVATTPQGVGTPYEDGNLVGTKMRQRFSPDGVSTQYQLCLAPIDGVDRVELAGQVIPPEQYTVDLQAGTLSFLQAPALELADSLEVTFTREVVGWLGRIGHCRWGTVYGGDNDLCVFLWGNPDYPATRFHSGLVNGVPSCEYFPETNYTLVGDGSAITDIVRHYDRQLIFTREAAYYSYPQTGTDSLGRTRTAYPVYALSTAAGSVAPGTACLVKNDPVTVSWGGLCRWQSTALREEKNARVFSERIQGALEHRDMTCLRLFSCKSQDTLWILTQEGDIFVYAARVDCFYKFTGLDCYSLWEDPVEQQIYFGTRDGRICQIGGTSDDGRAIEAYWQSGELDFSYPSYTKSLFRLGVEMTPCEDNALSVHWSCDVEGKNLPNSATKRFASQQRLFGWEGLDWSNFSFNTAYSRRLLTRRMEARRFSALRLTLRSGDPRELEISQLRFWGVCNDKII